MKKIVIILLLFCNLNAGASDWASLGKTLDGLTEIYIDKNSIKNIGNYKKAWLLKNYSSHQNIGDGFIFLSDKSLLYFSCGEMRSKFVSLINYELINGQGKSKDASFIGVFNDVVPDSVGEFELNFVCAYQLKK